MFCCDNRKSERQKRKQNTLADIMTSQESVQNSQVAGQGVTLKTGLLKDKKSSKKKESLSIVNERDAPGAEGGRDTDANIQRNIWTVIRKYRIESFVLFSTIYQTLLPFQAMYIIVKGPEFYGHCHTDTDPDTGEKERDCKLNYSKYQLYSSIFAGVQGVVAFLCLPQIGRLSDAYGRRPFLVLQVLVMIVVWIPFLFGSRYMWWHFGLHVFKGLATGSTNFSPFMTSYMGDTIEDEAERTIGFAAIYLTLGLAVLLGNVCALMIASFLGTFALVLAFFVMALVALLVVQFGVRESLAPELRKPIDNDLWSNPFAPLLNTGGNQIVKLVAIVQCLVSFPELAAFSNMISYGLDQMEVEHKSRIRVVSAVSLCTSATTLILFSSLVLPRLKARLSDVTLLVIGVVLLSLSLFIMAILSFWPVLEVMVLAVMTLACGLMVFPASNGILTKYLNKDEQGLGFGTVFSWRAVMAVLAPVCWSGIYQISKPHGLPWLAPLCASLICLSSLFIVCGPLKRTILEYDTKLVQVGVH